MARLFITEGLPCSGKSTMARFIADLTGGRFYDEGEPHPAECEFCAFIPDGAQGGFSARELSALAACGEKQDGGLFVQLYGLHDEALLQKALRFKVYDELEWNVERPVMLRRWQSFAQSAQDVYVFNCVLLQNPMCETMMRFNMPQEQSLEYIRSICEIIAPLDPVAIYLRRSDPARDITAALPERGQDWLDGVTEYHCSGGYGRAHALHGFEGYIAALKERQRRELAILERLPVRSFIIDEDDRERAQERVKELIGQCL